MGLDIYVRWGKQDPDEGWIDFPEDRREEQFTGFNSAPHAGYLRESWGSLSWCTNYAKQIGAPDPYGFFPNWDGGNGDELRCDEQGLLQVLAWRDEKLRPWTRDRKQRDAFYEKAKQQYEAMKPFESTEAHDAAWKELTESYTAFCKRIADVIGFLNFVELHKDKPNLSICFY